MYRQTSKKSTSKYHDRSLDDFIKNMKKCNLKSQRYDRIFSPDPLAPYRNNITHTLDRSRTLSGNKSRKTNKTVRQKVQKLLAGREYSRQKLRTNTSNKTKSQVALNLIDPADLISQYTKRIRQSEHYLQGKSKMGILLCKKFLSMLSDIVENMVLHMQHNYNQLQKSISERLQRQIGQRAKKQTLQLQKKVKKIQKEMFKLYQKQNYNSNLIYHLRLKNHDIDRQFGQCIFNSNDFGGLGYGRQNSSLNQDSGSLNYLSNSKLKLLKEGKLIKYNGQKLLQGKNYLQQNHLNDLQQT